MLNQLNVTVEQPTQISAKVLADSMNPVGTRLVTIEAVYPRSIHSELMTHRVFSRNTASSRAIPLSVTIKKVMADPFVPLHWGQNQKGMQAGDELDRESIVKAEKAILKLRDYAVDCVEKLAQLGLHKQIGNRYLEPWMWHTAIITSTDWLNFLHLRKNANAEPHLQDLATAIYEAIKGSKPEFLRPGEWHLPLIQPDELRSIGRRPEQMAQVSCARCARTSYLTHHGVRDMSEDIELYGRLLAGGHLSPLEHAAQATMERDTFFGNLRGWKSLRYLTPGESDVLAYRGEAEELHGLEGLH